MIKNALKTGGKEFKEKISGYLIAAFGLVAALAWNDAVKGTIEYLFPFDKNALTAKFLYAVIVTIVVIVVSVIVSKIFASKDKENGEGK